MTSILASIRRRDVLTLGAAAIATAALPSIGRAEELNVISWCDNITDDVLKPFVTDGLKVNGKEYDGTSAAVSILER